MKLPLASRTVLQLTAIAFCLALCLDPWVAGAGERSRENIDPLRASPIGEGQQVLNRRFKTVKGDIEAFRIFAENFRTKGETARLAQLQQPVDDYLKKHVNNLIAKGAEYSTLDGTKLTAEVMYLKARLLMSMNREDSAKAVIDDMKKRFAPYQNISVELLGRSTTLEEAIRQLDYEAAKTGSSQKKQGVR